MAGSLFEDSYMVCFRYDNYGLNCQEVWFRLIPSCEYNFVQSNRDIYALEQSCVEFGEEIQLQSSSRTDLSMAGDKTCTISKGSSFYNKEVIRDHPCREPEGSLLHALYLQLLAASKEGLTVRELFASFKTQTLLPSLSMDWKDRVRAHLKTNPYFGEVKGRYVLREQIVQLDATMSGFRAARCKSSVTGPDVQPFESAGIPTALHFSSDSNDTQEGMSVKCFCINFRVFSLEAFLCDSKWHASPRSFRLLLGNLYR